MENSFAKQFHNKSFVLQYVENYFAKVLSCRHGFVKNFTPPDSRAKNFTSSISPNFDSFSKKKHKKMSENGEIYTAGKKFTLPPALTALTNSTSVILNKFLKRI